MPLPINGSLHGFIPYSFTFTGVYLQGLQLEKSRFAALIIPSRGCPLLSFHLGFIVFCISTVLFISDMKIHLKMPL